MAALTIRNVDDATKQALRIRAAQHGVSMEEEARRILREALLRAAPATPLGQRLKSRFADVADESFQLPNRQMPRPAPGWNEPT
ncbi:MAG TPA: plasmid stabilization protein [Desulfomicrobiaceae bacterium]|jgi:plasmid stability protein|nr:plasmid stabilization protein [Desulfomicrobiaceae bacterium]MBC7355805.1 plasmid stabilization protein [Desulfomicrobiaceae bacterium]HCF06269.1 plasmid stabilization protein [Desulfomicrobiaceae bacterium]